MLAVVNLALVFHSTNTSEQLFVFLNRDLKTQNVFMKKKGNICKIGEDSFAV